MKLCVSSIAWSREEDSGAFNILEKEGVRFVETVPMRYGPSPANYRKLLQDHALIPIASQALLFGTSDLYLFASEERRDALFSHLSKLITEANGLGVCSLVFGSPKNRWIDLSTTSLEDADFIAIDFFRRLGKIASNSGVLFCLEPNPPIYGGNFLTTTLETSEFVRRVNSPGIRLNFDLGATIINEENTQELISEVIDIIGHIHISEPNLAAVMANCETIPNHALFAQALNDSQYEGIISIEMSRPKEGDWKSTLIKSISDVRSAYGVN